MTSETAYKLALLKALLDAAGAKIAALSQQEPLVAYATAEIQVDVMQARVLIAEWQEEK